jgi:rubrerythrin
MPPSVSSAEELMAMAGAMEREAARRYRQLAARMRVRKEDHLAKLFTFLAEIEEKHVTKIEDRAHELLAKPVSVMPAGWQVPETFDEEVAASHLLTPYRALALAVRNEDRAFAFYSYIAAHAPDEATQRLAEELAKDELEHAHLLRRERRAAFRNERPKRQASRGVPETLNELWMMSAEAESRAADYHYALAAALSAKDAALATLFARAAADEDDCAREVANRAGSARPAQLRIAEPKVEHAMSLLEEVFERYADIADRAKDETIIKEAQKLAARAVRRLSLVCGSFPQ